MHLYSKFILTFVDICVILYSSKKVHSGGVRALPLILFDRRFGYVSCFECC